MRGRAAAVAVVAAVALGGCTAAPASPTVDAPPATPPTAPSAAPTASARAPGASSASVRADLARFDAVARRTVARDQDAGGRAFIDALVAAGFDRSAMQVTEDRTSVGLAVPSVQFSVLRRGTCLVGQHGPGSDGYRSAAVEPVDGRCLIGRTRAIDW